MSSFFRKLAVTGLGTGYLPVAPGTWGSLGAVGVFLAVAWASGRNAWAVNAALLAVVVACSIGCVALGRFTESAFGKRDPGQCTIDEWAGQAVALLAVPLGGHWIDLLVAAGVAFCYFRLLDILKPPPARQAERLPLGWGVLVDDLVAGVYANVATQICVRVWGYAA